MYCRGITVKYINCNLRKLTVRTASLKILLLLFSILLASSCAVVRTPYFQSEYYNETVSELERIRPEVTEVTDSLYAGFSKKPIIPDMNELSPGRKVKKPQIPIAGYGQLKTRYATGINDSIFVRSVAIRTGDQTSIIVSAEMLIMPPDIAELVLSKLEKEGISRNQLFFSATHCHSGIGGWGYGLMARLMAGKPDKQLVEWLASQIKHSVTEALADLKPAMYGSASFEAPDYTINRLTGKPEHNNTSFDYILFEQTGGRKAIIGTYSAHSTTTSGKNTLISGDYPGYWSRKIENTSADIALFCGGSMGGQSPAGKGREFESAAYIGESLADSVNTNLGKVEMSSIVTKSSISLETMLPEYHFRMTERKNFTTRFSERLMAAPENVFLQAIKLNNLIWFFTPGDFSGEYAILLRRLLSADGYRSVVTGYNGSYVGYIFPGKYFYLDHYEPRTMGWFGPYLGEYIFELMDRMGKTLINRN